MGSAYRIVIDHWKLWHIGVEDLPNPGKEVYALIDEDTTVESEPHIVEATCRVVEGGNPPFLWEIKLPRGKTDKGRTIAGGSSVYVWRYK